MFRYQLMMKRYGFIVFITIIAILIILIWADNIAFIASQTEGLL